MKSTNDFRISYAHLAESVVQDPQFVLPRHPAMNEAVPYTFFSDRLVIEGPTSRRVMSGPSVFTVIRPLISAMDGERSWQELADFVDMSESTVQQGLNLLFMAGALVEGNHRLDDAPRAKYVARMVDATRVHASWVDALKTLSSASVRVQASPSLTTLLHESLASNQVRFTAGDYPSLIIIETLGRTPSQLERISRFWRHRNVPALPVERTERGARVGPVSWPDFGPCLACSAMTENRGPVPPAHPGDSSPVAAALTHEVVNLLGRVGHAKTTTASVELDFVSGVTSYATPAPGVSCPVCGPGITDGADSLAYQYEMSVTFPPRRLVDPRRNQVHYEESSAKLTLEAREFPGSDQVRLPAVGERLGQEREEGINLSSLGEILASAFGLRGYHIDGKLKRWAPTGGNLGSPQAYLHCSGVPQIPDGSYAYSAPHHALARLNVPRWVTSHPGIQLVFTGELNRVAKKYSTFGYRVVSLDSGVALLHAALIAERYGIRFVNLPNWNEPELIRRYALSNRDQAITGVMELYGESCQ